MDDVRRHFVHPDVLETSEPIITKIQADIPFMVYLIKMVSKSFHFEILYNSDYKYIYIYSTYVRLISIIITHVHVQKVDGTLTEW